MEIKSLKDLSLKELWELFPISLENHNAQWKKWADEEIYYLKNLLIKYQPIINHIGSTSIPGIKSKPIVDILAEIKHNSEWSNIIPLMENSGYFLMNQMDRRLSFNKGYSLSGYEERVFHIHIHEVGDNLEIIFRNYLSTHPQIAKEYEKLKISLLSKYGKDRDAYTRNKTEFINQVLKLASIN